MNVFQTEATPTNNAFTLVHTAVSMALPYVAVTEASNTGRGFKYRFPPLFSINPIQLFIPKGKPPYLRCTDMSVPDLPIRTHVTLPEIVGWLSLVHTKIACRFLEALWERNDQPGLVRHYRDLLCQMGVLDSDYKLLAHPFVLDRIIVPTNRKHSEDNLSHVWSCGWCKVALRVDPDMRSCTLAYQKKATRQDVFLSERWTLDQDTTVQQACQRAHWHATSYVLSVLCNEVDET